jgi:hypothetical protein
MHLFEIMTDDPGWTSDPALFLIYTLVLLGVSALSYRYIEFYHEPDTRRVFATA